MIFQKREQTQKKLRLETVLINAVLWIKKMIDRYIVTQLLLSFFLIWGIILFGL